jgi:hypothetical protein
VDSSVGATDFSITGCCGDDGCNEDDKGCLGDKAGEVEVGLDIVLGDDRGECLDDSLLLRLSSVGLATPSAKQVYIIVAYHIKSQFIIVAC